MAVVYATIKNRITHVPDDVELVCNNPTDVIEIEFDEEWSGKTGYVARFEWNGKYYDVPFEGNCVKVPELSNTTWIMFGVYADNITAAPTKVKCKKSILCYGDSVRHVPANPFYDEFVERLENVEKAVEHGGGGSGGISEETDPTVPAWAKQPEKPKYTAEEVGAQPKGDYALKSEIPSVPVQTVNGKTGAVQLSARDVGALPAETEIPEPYTLPTASAEVKGGVKIGEGLQMDGDVLGVVPEPQLELIETIVCDGTYSNLARTGFSLKRVVLYIHTQAADVAASIGVEIKNGKELFGYLWIANGINTGERWAYVNAVSDGEQAAYLEGTAAATSSYGSATLGRTAPRIDGDTPITRVGAYVSGNTCFPEGSTIEIWGVRANA